MSNFLCFEKKYVEYSMKILGFFRVKRVFYQYGFLISFTQKNPGSTSFDTYRLPCYVLKICTFLYYGTNGKIGKI